MERHIIRYDYDPDADAMYVLLSEAPYAFGRDIDAERRIDYSEDQTPIGIELLAVSHGVDLDGLPYANEVRHVLARVQGMVPA